MTNTTTTTPIRLNSGLANWTQALLWLTAAACVVTTVLALNYRQALDAWSQDRGTLDKAVSAEDTFYSWSSILTLIGLATFILLIVWLAKAHAATSSLLLDRQSRKYSLGWSIGVWFIPFANAISTPQVFAENQRIADTPRVNGRTPSTWKNTPVRSDLIWWWILFLGGIITYQVGLSMSINDDMAFQKLTSNLGIDEYLNGLAIAGVGIQISAAGAVFGALFIRNVSARLTSTGNFT